MDLAESIFSFARWHASDLDTAEVIELDDQGWTELRDFYLPIAPDTPRHSQAGAEAFDRVLEVARSAGARSACLEYRYIDVDYRSEFKHFYGSTFRRYPSVCHRLHFFAAQLEPDLINLAEVAKTYVGYTTIRPLETSPIGRTVLPPPADLRDALLCVATDTVHLRGVELTVTGMPFTSQDGQYLRCSHSALWMATTYWHLAGETPRFLPHQIHDAAKGGTIQGRELPHEGLTVPQLMAAIQALGFSGPLITFPNKLEDSQKARTRSLPAQLCRYLNGRVPIIVHNRSHAWLAIGYYYHADDEPAHDSARFVFHDDIRGPYLTSDTDAAPHNPWTSIDVGKPWRGGLPVLPPKVYITAEKAELLGRERLEVLAEERRYQGPLAYRTRLTRGVDFKAWVIDVVDDALLRGLYLDTHLPRNVWVVEAIDENLARTDRRCVVGEAVIDCTANHLASADSPALLTLRFQQYFKATSLDFQQPRSEDQNTGAAWPPLQHTGVSGPIDPRRNPTA